MMCTESVDVCKTEIDLYDDAILGNGPVPDSVEVKDTLMMVTESNSPEREDEDGMILYDDVPPSLSHSFQDYDSRSARHESQHKQYSHDHDKHYSVRLSTDNYSVRLKSACKREDNFLYIGNLTWWTSDLELSDAIRNIGVSDILDIKFFENASNGQSKGFCKVTLGSEHSMRKVKDRLPDVKLHGRRPDVEYPTRNVLYKFEAQNPLSSRSKRFSSNSQVAW
uniref:Cleavage and polyadenylation specificity factor subunit CG7185 n=1 Tax=Cacopsylla melanoneura TaxID=428564 RepID=A0A8D9FDH7_9HEMI